MSAPPGTVLLRLCGSLTLHVGPRSAGGTRRRRAGSLLSSCRRARARAGRGRRSCSSSIRVLTRTVVAATVRLVPLHHILIVGGARASVSADAGRVVLEGCEVGGLAEAGPDGLRGTGVAAAGLGGAHEVATCLRTGWELAIAGCEDLGGGCGEKEGEEVCGAFESKHGCGLLSLRSWSSALEEFGCGDR